MAWACGTLWVTGDPVSGLISLVIADGGLLIDNVAVHPRAQGTGVGRRLMEHAEELARAGGFHSLGLMVSSHNTGARALYERLSFRTTNLLMRKEIDAG